MADPERRGGIDPFDRWLPQVRGAGGSSVAGVSSSGAPLGAGAVSVALLRTSACGSGSTGGGVSLDEPPHATKA